MWKKLRNIWLTNHGWWLLIAGGITYLLASLLWYVQWPGDLWLSQRSNRPLLTQKIQPQTGILVAQVNSQGYRAGTNGLILLFRPDRELDDPPAFRQEFQLDESGLTTLLMVLPPGDYAVVAFLDLNNNGQLDFDGTRPAEPMRFPLSKSTNEPGTLEQRPEITLTPQEPLLCVFRFVAP